MYDTVITLRHYTLRHYAAHNSTSNSGFRSVRLRPKGKALMTKAKPSPDGALRNRETRSRGGARPGNRAKWREGFRLLKRRCWLRDYSRLVMPKATSHSDCSGNDDCAGK